MDSLCHDNSGFAIIRYSGYIMELEQDEKLRACVQSGVGREGIIQIKKESNYYHGNYVTILTSCNPPMIIAETTLQVLILTLYNVEKISFQILGQIMQPKSFPYSKLLKEQDLGCIECLHSKLSCMICFTLKLVHTPAKFSNYWPDKAKKKSISIHPPVYQKSIIHQIQNHLANILNNHLVE